MGPVTKRILGYGVAGTVAAGLVWAGFAREVDPDLMTMANSVEVQLKMAAAMPPRGPDGQPLAERESLIASARGYLERIERQEADFLPAIEYRAFLAFLAEDFAGAAGLYRRLRGEQECTEQQRDFAVLNEARMLKLAGEDGAARQLVQAHEASFLPENRAIAARMLGDDPPAPPPGDGAVRADARAAPAGK